MILAVDVHYKDEYAKAVGVLFSIDDNKPSRIIIKNIKDFEAYTPGQFYKRELPCIMKVIKEININTLDSIIIDGYVYVDNDCNNGLGGCLYEAIEGKVPVMGVAKNSFKNNQETVIEVFRGESKNPLYISSIGIEIAKAAQLIKNMQGKYRIPDILKHLDILTKED